MNDDKDHRASLLRVDPSAGVTTEPLPYGEKEQLIDRLTEIRDAFIASGDEADAMDAGVIDYAMFKLGQEWVTRVTSEDEDSPSVIGSAPEPASAEKKK